MSQNQHESLNLHSLLETYSIGEISELFSKIDEKIVSLHEVSSEDFLRLNTDFKNFHQEAREISDNASYLFDFITGNGNNDLTGDIDQIYKELRSQSDQVQSRVELVRDLINRLLSRLRQSFFPLKNFKQNLTSLKFLISNLELNAPTSDDQEMKIVQDRCDELKEKLTTLEKLFSMLKQLLKDKFLIREQFSAENVDINKILDLLKEEIESYTKHYHSAREIIPEIKAKTDATSEHINKIVTNLQYQDIIKQKMEHIQHTHKELLGELERFEQDTQTKLHTKAKYFLRLRDIAGLQAAQLIHTNKEYQTAIQRISDRFLEIGENMTLVSRQCAEYTSFDSKQQKIFFHSLKNNLYHAREKIQRFCEFNNNFNKNVDDIVALLDKIEASSQTFQPLLHDLERYVEGMIREKTGKNADQNMFRQVRQVMDDLKGNREVMSGIFIDYASFREELNRKIVSNIAESQDGGCDDLPAKITRYMENLGKLESQIVEKLSKNNVLSDKIFKEVQESVNRIQYYEYFEKVIGEIIEDLNVLNFNLKTGAGEDLDNKKDNLRRLKEYYTMNSEYVIHEAVSNAEEQNIDVEEEGGDLELF